MSNYFLQAGKTYEVITHPNCHQTMDDRQHLYHYFEQGTKVTCTRVMPKGPNNPYGRLAGLFVNAEDVDQELCSADVKAIKETK